MPLPEDPPCLPPPAGRDDPICWRPCGRACHATLRWPTRRDEGPGGSVGIDTLPVPLPALPDPAHLLLAELGEHGLRRLVRRHMERLQLSALFAQTPECWDCVTQRIGDHVVEACGGALRRHADGDPLRLGAGLPVLLDARGREIWLVQLWHSFGDLGLTARQRAAFWDWAEPLSLYLLAPQARRQGVRRYRHHQIAAWCGEDGPPGAEPGA